MSHKCLATLFGLIAILGLLILIGPVCYLFWKVSPEQIWKSICDSEVAKALWITMSAGALATLAAMLSGLPVAYWLSRSKGQLASLLEAAINLTIAIPHVAVGIMLLMFLSPQTILGDVLSRLHVFFVDNYLGVCLCMWYMGFPYVVSSSVAGFKGVKEEFILVAKNLGASDSYVFRNITLPLAAPAILRGGALCLARGLGEMGSLLILAYHPQVITILMLGRFQEQGLGAAQGITAVALLVNLVLFILIFWGLRMPYDPTRG